MLLWRHLKYLGIAVLCHFPCQQQAIDVQRIYETLGFTELVAWQRPGWHHPVCPRTGSVRAGPATLTGMLGPHANTNTVGSLVLCPGWLVRMGSFSEKHIPIIHTMGPSSRSSCSLERPRGDGAGSLTGFLGLSTIPAAHRAAQSGWGANKIT